MRICFVTNFIPPYRKTFYEKLCCNSAHTWLVVRGRVKGETGRPEYTGGLQFPTVDANNVERKLGPLTLRMQQGALAAVRKHSPDVVVMLGMVGNLSNWMLLVWARLTGRKVVMWACGWQPQATGSVSLSVKQLLMRLHFNLADRCLLYSSKGRDYLASVGVRQDRMVVCYNGIEIDDLLLQENKTEQDAAQLRAENLAGDDFIFLYVGGLIADKRVDLLLDAFEEIRGGNPRAVLWIVGDGPEAVSLRQYAALKNNGGVRFFGRIVDDVDRFFSAADVFVLPGIGGLAFNQAMIWRTPCIGSEADGTEDDLLLDGKTGFRFIRDNTASLQAAMAAAISAPEAAMRAMGEEARQLIVDRSNVTRMVETFKTCIDELAPIA